MDETSGRFANTPECVAAARSGDQAAWNYLVVRFNRLLRHICHTYRLAPHDCDDIVQQTWFICFQKLDQLRDDSLFPGWLSSICRHECLHLLEGQRRCVLVDDVPDPQGTSAGTYEDDPVVTALLRREETDHLNSAVNDLPDRQRTLLRALAAPDFSDYASTAADLSMPIGSVGPTRARAIATLRSHPLLQAAG